MMGEGTVNDEELVEIMAEAMVYKAGAGGVLAALRSAGFQVFRPEDCATAQQLTGRREDAAYFLVPADSGGSG